MGMKNFIKELNSFLGKAAMSTYAGGSGSKVDPENLCFVNLEFKQGDWYYKDSYTGFFQSWGREVIWYKGKPVWTQIYGGGMVKQLQNDTAFAHRTFDFLKKALSAGEKKEKFQPRGPKQFKYGDWKYVCRVKGDITKFEGHEKIFFKNNIVFTHDFLGGLIIAT